MFEYLCTNIDAFTITRLLNKDTNNATFFLPGYGCVLFRRASGRERRNADACQDARVCRWAAPLVVRYCVYFLGEV